MQENFLEEMLFLPSLELTKRLLAAVAAVVRLSDRIRAREDREQAEDIGDDYLQNLPSDEPAEASLTSPPPFGSEEEEILFQRRLIAEELYHRLAFLSGSTTAKRGLRSRITQLSVMHIVGMMGVLSRHLNRSPSNLTIEGILRPSEFPTR